MSDLTDDRLNNTIALLVAVTATALALTNIKDGNVVQRMSVARSQSVNAWAHYQAKSLKQSLAQSALDQLELQAQIVDRFEVRARITSKVAGYRGEIERYEGEKLQIKLKAESFEKDYERLNFTDDQLDMAEACLSMALALYGVTALTRRRWLLYLSGFVAVWGTAHALAGFAGWGFRPEWFAQVLG
jgi:hypothetical protein